MRGRRRLARIAVVGAAVLSACATGAPSGPRPPEYLTRAPADETPRACHYVATPGELPAFDVLARPGARATLVMLADDRNDADSTELSARYDESGRLAWIRAIRASAPADPLARLEQALLSELNPDGPADWGFRMHIVGGDVVSIAPSVRCPAELEDDSRVTISPPVAYGGLARDRLRGRPYRAWITIDERGRVTRVRMDATSGHRIGDEFITQYILRLTFVPQLHDGIPVQATIRETIYIPDSVY